MCVHSGGTRCEKKNIVLVNDSNWNEIDVSYWDANNAMKSNYRCASSMSKDAFFS